MLTTIEKRQYLQAIVAGRIKPNHFSDIPQRTFTRISPLTNELNNSGEGAAVEIGPDTVFMCAEENQEYKYREIEAIADGQLIWATIAQDPKDPAGVEALEISGAKEEDLIKYFLNNKIK